MDFAGCKRGFSFFSIMLVAGVLQSHTAEAFGRGRFSSSGGGSNPPASTPVPPVATPAPIGNHPIDGANTCVSSDPARICLGLKIVSYEKDKATVIAREAAINLVNEMNQIWGQCNIAFQLETYQSTDPVTHQLNYDSNWRYDSDEIRRTFNDNSTLLVVALGKLSGSTIGVTQMPGAGVYGSLIEDDYAHNALTVGHELGHYLGLYHLRNNQNLMYAYIGDHTDDLTSNQCSIARSTAQESWKNMLRK